MAGPKIEPTALKAMKNGRLTHQGQRNDNGRVGLRKGVLAVKKAAMMNMTFMTTR
jgi:hypothetical protein